jgi:hypothetical protein
LVAWARVLRSPSFAAAGADDAVGRARWRGMRRGCCPAAAARGLLQRAADGLVCRRRRRGEGRRWLWAGAPPGCHRPPPRRPPPPPPAAAAAARRAARYAVRLLLLAKCRRAARAHFHSIARAAAVTAVFYLLRSVRRGGHCSCHGCVTPLHSSVECRGLTRAVVLVRGAANGHLPAVNGQCNGH